MFANEELNGAGIPERYHKATNIICELIIFGSIIFFLTLILR